MLEAKFALLTRLHFHSQAFKTFNTDDYDNDDDDNDNSKNNSENA